MRLARNGDVEGIRAYVRSDAFLAAFVGLNPGHRQTAMRCHFRAEALCEAKAPRPLIEPRPIDARRAQKVSWSDPGMRTRLAEAYARARGDDEKAARILGVSLGSARLAKRRHLDGAWARQCQKALISGHGRRSPLDAQGYEQFSNGQRHGLQAALTGRVSGRLATQSQSTGLSLLRYPRGSGFRSCELGCHLCRRGVGSPRPGAS
jgi:hypothetical protein